MSVATKNPFAILDDDASRPSSPGAAENKTEAPAPAPATRGTPKSRGPASRGGRYYQRGGKPREAGDAAAEDAPAGEEGAKKRFDGEGRGRGGRGRGRGDRGDRGRGGRGRAFDRHSATGKTDSDKKVHQSWGGDEGNAELKAEQAGNIDAIAESSPAAEGETGWDGAATAADDIWNTPAPAADAAPADADKSESRKPREREPEEEDNTLTYEQYLAQREAAAIPKVEAVREANDGAGDLWKDAVQHTKKTDDEDTYFVGKTKSAPKARAKKDEKVFIEIDARFERPSRGGSRGRGGERGGDRGGRGGERGRGRGGRGGARPPRTNGSAPIVNVDDEAAFPSLS